MDITRGQLLRSSALAGLAVATTAPSTAARTRPARPQVRLRGVGYEITDGETPSTGWQAARMRSDLKAIRTRLHATTVSIFGDGVERLTATAEEAANQGFSIFLQPRLGDVPEAAILEHLAETGRYAEKLRRSGARVHLSVGCEFVLFVPGIVPGADALERIANLLAGTFDPVHMQRELARFIELAARTGRRVFHGPLTYAAAEDDEVDWSQFDLVSVDYYSYERTRRGHVQNLRGHQRRGKPLVVSEFGSCTYVGAPQDGGMGWTAVDYTKDPAELKPGYVRSEHTQAEYLLDVYEAAAAARVYAATVYSFVAPDSPHRRDPRYDLDIASYGIVKPVRSEGTWHWEPKEAFRALARRWAA